MSITYSADVFCDNCGNWTRGVVSDKPSGMAKPALAKAKREGWSRDVNSLFTDLCPDCLGNHRRGLDVAKQKIGS